MRLSNSLRVKTATRCGFYKELDSKKRESVNISFSFQYKSKQAGDNDSEVRPSQQLQKIGPACFSAIRFYLHSSSTCPPLAPSLLVALTIYDADCKSSLKL